jgi:hypothetical protein
VARSERRHGDVSRRQLSEHYGRAPVARSSGVVGTCLAVNGVGTTTESQWRTESGVIGTCLVVNGVDTKFVY